MAYQRPGQSGILQSMTGNKFGGGYLGPPVPAEAVRSPRTAVAIKPIEYGGPVKPPIGTDPRRAAADFSVGGLPRPPAAPGAMDALARLESKQGGLCSRSESPAGTDGLSP